MSDISLKKQLSRTLTQVIRNANKDAAQLAGQQWPVSVVSVDGAIVTVAFEVASDFTLPQVTVPIAESRYVRLPVQPGDRGMVVAASVRLGGVTGLGSGLAPLVAPTNLGGLVYVPLGNKAWPTIDANAVVLQAPNGSKILTDDGVSEIIVDTNQVKVTQGAVTVTITGGDVTIDAPNNVTITVPQTTINGNLSVNGDVHVTGNTSVTGTLAVTGAATFASSVACASLTCAGAGSFATLTVGGKSFLSHEHAAGTYHIGSSSVAGNSGIPI